MNLFKRDNDQRRLTWDPEAEARLGDKVPAMVRPLVRRKVEERVRAAGGRRVTLADFAAAEDRFKALTAGQDPEEIAAVMPAENRPGAEMVVLSACRNELAGCPNVVLDTAAWRERVQEWLARGQVSERLRARVAGEKILFHHKLRIAIAGCVNGCSRPQIADLALVGTTTPQFDPALCSACGQCADACPDCALAVEDGPPVREAAACQGCLVCSRACPEGAVSTTGPAAHIMMGGKLGRHPHLAQRVLTTPDPDRAVAAMAEAVERYLAEAQSGERFAAWWVRAQGLAGPCRG